MSRPGVGDREALVRAAVRLELFTIGCAIVLDLTGPPGTREFLAAMLDEM